MLLRSLRVKNFRSLEDISLESLDQFNVLIGRNNAGKSSVFGAISLVAAQVFGRGVPPFPTETLLTDRNALRQLSIDLTFEVEDHERNAFLRLVATYPTGIHEPMLERLISSSMLRRMSYRFESLPGDPSTLSFRETRIMAEDSQWAPIYEVVQSSERVPEARLVDLPGIAGNLPDGPLPADSIDISTATNFLGTRFHNLMTVHEESERNTLDLWLMANVADYFGTLFFFSPFRHAVEVLQAEPGIRLTSDGSNLAPVLNYLSGARRRQFQEVEELVQQAIPDVGMLQPELLPVEAGHGGPQHVRISFEQPNGNSVLLRDMGGGVEELLMAATVIATEGRSATLFLEEPETHLHPGAQRYLAERFRTGVKQVFIATHSATFINVPPPRAIYRVSLSEGRTVVVHASDTEELARALEEIDARNSDVLLSDAVLFLEGPSDRDVFQVWSHTLGLSFAERNLTVLAMGGGRDAARHAPIRSDILSSISSRVRIPHLFILDRDERSNREIDHLGTQLGTRVHILAHREIENYLLAPMAIWAALREKYADNAPVRGQVEAADSATIMHAIEIAAEGLFGTVLLKRIRTEIGGLPEGFLPPGDIAGLAAHARDENLPDLILEAISNSALGRIQALDLPSLVRLEKERLEQDWIDASRHVTLAPGAEILSAVFEQFGGEYTKRTDASRIASAMSKEEIAPEITEIVGRAAALTRT